MFKVIKEEFVVIGKEGSTLDGEGFIQKLWKDAANKKASEELAERIPHGSLSVISGSGHEVNQQAPARLAEALDGFWKD